MVPSHQRQQNQTKKKTEKLDNDNKQQPLLRAQYLFSCLPHDKDAIFEHTDMDRLKNILPSRRYSVEFFITLQTFFFSLETAQKEYIVFIVFVYFIVRVVV